MRKREYKIKSFDLDLLEMYKTFKIRKRLQKCTDFKTPSKWSFKILYYRYIRISNDLQLHYDDRIDY